VYVQEKKTMPIDNLQFTEFGQLNQLCGKRPAEAVVGEFPAAANRQKLVLLKESNLTVIRGQSMQPKATAACR
jgi:hypothetical protein